MNIKAIGAGTMRITFEEVKYPVSKNLKCAGGCGKKVKRSKTFTATINPFNKNPDGTVRNRSEIYKMLAEKALPWTETPEICKHCKGA